MKIKFLLLAVSAVSLIAVGCDSVNDASVAENESVITSESAMTDNDITDSSVTTVLSDDKNDSSIDDNSKTDQIAQDNESYDNEENDDLDYENADSNEPTRQTLDELIENNFECMAHIFVLGHLPSEGNGNDDLIEEIDWDDENSYIRKVTDSRFPDYESFSEYIHSVYTDSTANMLLNNYPYEGGPKYINKDGELYIDLSKDGGKGYYVNWQNRTISIGENENENICHFTVETTITLPSDNPVEEPYVIDCTAVYEDGRWVLEEMYS